MYDHETRKVNLLARRGAPSDLFCMEKYMSIDNLPFSQVLQRGQPVFVDTLRDALPDLREMGLAHGRQRPPGLQGPGGRRPECGQLPARSVFIREEKNILELIGKEAGTLVSKLQTETALRESEKYYRTLIDTSPDVIVVIGPQSDDDSPSTSSS